ncbi:hypothetical protein [Cohnella sp. AR92]|uniref:hypothetical protein n=1 Tax=Cohnella sp. AR92 TaxID=648716 RepID=UPI000F8D1277|nr:hypothetical protein [Cohnella sp. AR92]RUS47582.1 hypothetical protein ELR57_07255 [Cohnella sp. AR92]
MIQHGEDRRGRWPRRAALPLLMLVAIFWLAGCGNGESKLRFDEVSLASEPAAAAAGAETKLIVEVDNDKYKDKEAKVQIQINSNSTLPQLLDAAREEDNYVVSYTFPKAEQYTITIHMYYGEDEHYAFGKPFKVS